VTLFQGEVATADSRCVVFDRGGNAEFVNRPRIIAAFRQRGNAETFLAWLEHESRQVDPLARVEPDETDQYGRRAVRPG